MAQENPQNAGIARYIREMSPQARELLAKAMENAQLSGDDKQHLIADTLYKTMKEFGEISTQELARRAILEPIEQFVVPEKRDTKVAAIIPRHTLDMIWRWVSEELASETIAQVQNALADAAPSEKNNSLIEAVQDDVSAQMYAALAKLHGQQKQQLRMAGQLGGKEALKDAEEVALLLKHRKVILAIRRNFEGMSRLKAEEKAVQLKSRLDTIHGRAKEIFPFVLVQAKELLNSLPNFVRFIVMATGSRDAEVIARSAYSHAITLMRADLERIISHTYNLTQSNDAAAIADSIKSFGIGMRAIETELEFSPHGQLSKDIRELRSEIANLVWKRLENYTVRLTWLIRPRQGDRTSILILDNAELDMLAADTQILLALRNYAGEFALSAITTRTVNETKDMLETGIPLLIDRLRKETGAAQTSVKGRVEGAIRLAELFLGNHYGQVQKRSMELALQNNTKTNQA